jgi:hypothetical protein
MESIQHEDALRAGRPVDGPEIVRLALRARRLEREYLALPLNTDDHPVLLALIQARNERDAALDTWKDRA